MTVQLVGEVRTTLRCQRSMPSEQLLCQRRLWSPSPQCRSIGACERAAHELAREAGAREAGVPPAPTSLCASAECRALQCACDERRPGERHACLDYIASQAAVTGRSAPSPLQGRWTPWAGGPQQSRCLCPAQHAGRPLGRPHEGLPQPAERASAAAAGQQQRRPCCCRCRQHGRCFSCC